MIITVSCCIISSLFTSLTYFYQGIDDWNITHIQGFLQKHSKSKISLDALCSHNLVDGHAFVALGNDEIKTEAILNDIITESSLFHSKKVRVIQAHTAIKNELDKKPIDFYEWRLLNMRLCNLWILPLTMSPRALLIWARYVDTDPTIEIINDEIDEVSNLVFWTYWIVSPSALLSKIICKFNTHTLLDEVLDWLLFIRYVYEIIQFISFCVFLVKVHLLNSLKIEIDNATTEEDKLSTFQVNAKVTKADAQIVINFLTKEFVRDNRVLLFALLMYYGFYYVVPIQFWDTFFAVYVYILKPWDLILIFTYMVLPDWW